LDKHLKNKNILITGASRGIGKAIAEYFLLNNARVGLHYNRQASGAKELTDRFPGQTCSFQSDLAKLEFIPNLVDRVIQDMGHIDVLVNNAGIAISSEISGSDDLWIDDWKKTMEVNLNAVGLLCKKIIQYFTKNNIKGKIINISSRAAFRGDTEDYLAYAASKAGVVALTRSIARAYGKDGIVAFNVAPGFVNTEMAQQFFDQYGKGPVLEQIALNTLTTPEDVAPFVGFLASGLADHATGGTFDINAGSYVH
jgi:NAD(P)-dependent dehydrogenase (short-subunit alcohol dehydrogenase family)